MSAWSSSQRTRPEHAAPAAAARVAPRVRSRAHRRRARHQFAGIVRAAVEDRLRSGRPMQQHYDHPLLFLQHMIWHEGYHHGQIKLALKLAGHPFDDEQIGALTWDLWMNKTASSN